MNSYRRIFRNLPFRRFWLGSTFSVLGDAMTRVALTWFVYETTHSAEALGLLLLCYTGPIVVGGLIAGWLLDRFERRKVMLIDNLIRGVAVASLPVLYALGQLALWHVYLVAAVYGALMMISLAGGPSLIPGLVHRDQLATANAMESLSFVLGGILGPALAGPLIAAVGAPNVVIFDALSYFVFALALSRIRTPIEARPAASAGERTYSLGASAQLLLKNKVLFSTTFMFLAANIGAGFIGVYMPIWVDRGLGGGAALYGALLGAAAIGDMISAFVVGSLDWPLPLGASICLAQILAGASLGLMLVDRSIALTALSLGLFGLFSAPLTIWAQTLRMQVIPERLRGRTFALLRTLMLSGDPIGGAVGGLLLPMLGIPAMMVLSALLIGAPGLVGYQVRALRSSGWREDLLSERAVVEGEQV